MIDNSDVLRQFVQVTDDGDSFLYTEIIDRAKRQGNNGARLLRTFYHRSVEDFDRHLAPIRAICDTTGARAYTRPSARSWRMVGATFTRLVVDASLTGNWSGMKTLYSSACGKTSPISRLWLFDVDSGPADEALLIALIVNGSYLCQVPSNRGVHYITRPFDLRTVAVPPGVTLLKDHPTNLYIPTGAVSTPR